MKQICLQGVFVGSLATLKKTCDMLNKHDIKPVIDKAFAFSEAVLAFEFLQNQKHMGKVCISYE